MATKENGGTQPAAPLTQTDILAVVQAVTAALQDQLKEHHPTPANSNCVPTDSGEGTSAQIGRTPPNPELLQIIAVSTPDWTSPHSVSCSALLSQGLVASNKTSYQTGQNRYLTFCSDIKN